MIIEKSKFKARGYAVFNFLILQARITFALEKQLHSSPTEVGRTDIPVPTGIDSCALRHRHLRKRYQKREERKKASKQACDRLHARANRFLTRRQATRIQSIQSKMNETHTLPVS